MFAIILAISASSNSMSSKMACVAGGSVGSGVYTLSLAGAPPSTAIDAFRPRPLHVGVVDLLGHRLGQGHLLIALASHRGQAFLAELPFESQGSRHLLRHQAHRTMLH